MTLYLEAGGILFLAASLFWLISVKKHDVSIVDSLWPVFFILFSITIYLAQTTPSFRALLVVILVCLWGLRLAAYITLRHRGKAEDHRYQTIRNNNQSSFALKSLWMIFYFQALVALIVALPLYFSITAPDSSLGWLTWFGCVLFYIGFIFETVADQQLWLFKLNPENKGKLYQKGLRAYSRHPNYFGESLVWWGLFGIALDSGAWYAIISPILMTFLLLKFSGVSLLEKRLQHKKGFDQYQQQTPAFFPRLWGRNKSEI